MAEFNFDEVVERGVKRAFEMPINNLGGRSFNEILKGFRQGEIVPVVRCRDCKYSDTFYVTTTDTMTLKCLNIRYGGVYPDWYCEHGEPKEAENGTDHNP